MKHTFYLSKETQNKAPLDRLDKKLCFMGNNDTFKRFMKIKEKELGKRNRLIFVDFLDFIQDHQNCTRTMKQMFYKINRNSRSTKSDEGLLNELNSFYHFGSEIGQLLVRKKEVEPSPLSVQFKEVFDRLYTWY